jgi:hypothetical protein
VGHIIRFPAGSNLDEVLGIIAGTHERLECFTHIDDKDPTKLTKYNVTGLNRYCVENKVEIVLVPLTKEGALLCRNARGLEQHRYDRITEAVIDNLPVIFCLQEDGTGLLVDGTHRYARAWDLGYDEIRAYVLQPDQWKSFLLVVAEGLTAEELLKQDSGL